MIFLLLAVAFTLPVICRAEADPGNGTPKAAAAVKSAPASKSPSYVLRYICFVAAPRQAGTFAAKETPQVLRDLQAGTGAAPLDPTPQAFLNRLSAADARLFYRLLLSGETSFAPGVDSPAVATIRAAWDPRAPSAVAVEEQVEVMPDEAGDGTLALRRTGALMRRTDPDSGNETVRWKGAVKRSIVPGRTYSHVTAKLPTGERLIYAYSVVEAGH